MMEILADAAALAFSPSVIIAVFAGVLLGVTIGAIPGLSGDMAIAVLLPFVFTMEAAPALGLLMGIYKGSMFGGSISAITFGVPGTPAAAATVLDGYPAGQAGRPNAALHTALYASCVGDIVGVGILIFATVPLALVAIQFGPREFVALYVVSLALVAALTFGQVARGFAASAIGVLISMVGRDPFSGTPRLTLGIEELGAGLGLVPVLVGLFAVSEIMVQAARSWSRRALPPPLTPSAADRRRDRLGWAEFRGQWRALTVGSSVGTFIGALPGAGATLAAFLAYGITQRIAREPGRFGKGSLEGVAAPESANSATAGAALIPLFAFGIPGSGTAALVGAALVMQGITPGPQMIDANMVFIYALFILLVYGCFFNLVSSKLLLPHYARIASIDQRFVAPVVLGLAILGTYATNNSVLDVWVLLAFGLIGVALRTLDIPMGPLVLGFLLGPGLERALRQGLMLGRNDWTTLFTGGIAIGIYAGAAAIMLAFFAYAWRRRRATEGAP